MNALKWFFGFVEYSESEIEGAWSWQHLLFVSACIVAMIGFAVFFGVLMRNKSYKAKNIVIIVAAITINAFETIKIVVACINSDDIIRTIRCSLLPLFLCSIQLIALPMAAFCKDRLKEACLDFVMIFGILGAIFGTIGAAQNYNAYPVFAFHNVVSAITHSISGFASIYIMISGMLSLKKKNMYITFSITGVFSVIAYMMNVFNGLAFEDRVYDDLGRAAASNYMFLMYHDSTPYSIFYNMVGGNKVIYPLIVVGAFIAYAYLIYIIPVIISKIKEKKAKGLEKK